MRKLLCLILCVGLLASGSTAIASDAEAILAIGVWKLLQSTRPANEEVVYKVRMNFKSGEWTVPINILNGRRTQQAMCWKVAMIGNLPNPSENIFSKHGIKEGNWIVAYTIDIKPDRFVARKCTATHEAIVNDLQNGMNMISDGYTWWIKVVTIDEWRFNDNGDKVPNKVTMNDYAIKY